MCGIYIGIYNLSVHPKECPRGIENTTLFVFDMEDNF